MTPDWNNYKETINLANLVALGFKVAKLPG